MVWAVVDSDAWVQLTDRCRPLFRRVFDPHVTLAYNVRWSAYESQHPGVIGSTGTIRVTACASGDRIQAAVVDLSGAPFRSVNPHPHITISAADEIKPVESNIMLAGPHKRVELQPPLPIPVQVEFIPFDRQ